MQSVLGVVNSLPHREALTDAVLGIDTSNYTTSAALVTLRGEILADSRQLLPVKAGEVGLRQSDALFLHLKLWPAILAELSATFSKVSVNAVAYSARPRPIPDSYMPTFLAGEAFARSVAVPLNVAALPFTHQEGHMRAALYGLSMPHEAFIAIHISGGTTDILLVRPRPTAGFEITCLGESTDLHAGQFIDRVGVKMGLAFPCGRAMDDLAQANPWEPTELPSSVNGAKISFSGPASAAERALASGARPHQVAQGVFRCISNSLEKVLAGLPPSAPQLVLLCGGVAANTHIRERLQLRLRRFRFQLSRVDLASDNAVGIALLGRDSIAQATVMDS